MSKTIKTVLSAIIVVLIATFGYFFRSTPPTSISFQETSDGCLGVFVYKINKDDTVGISVDARKEELKLSTTAQTFEVGKTDGLEVEILVGEQIKRLYCDDVSYLDQLEPRQLIGKSGEAIISISGIDKSKPEEGKLYTATVILRNVRFSDYKGSNSYITVDELIFKDVLVGWSIG